MKTEGKHVAGMPHLDICTISEDWALTVAVQNHWTILARSIGLAPSKWYDSQGDRMYAAVVALTTWFDPATPVREDDRIHAATSLRAIRKPHALSRTRFVVDGRCRAEVGALTTFIKRRERSSNKKFAKVRDLWTADDMQVRLVDAVLDRHFAIKQDVEGGFDGPLAHGHEVNRIQDFNNADFMYFKNFVRLAKAAEWRENRGRPIRLNAQREAWYFGNVEDGDQLSIFVARDEDSVASTIRSADGRLLFHSRSTAPVVDLAAR